MRLQCERPCRVRQCLIGGARPLVCLPLVGSDIPALLSEAQAALVHDPDLLEWRADHFQAIEDLSQVLAALAELRSTIGVTPLIFTCRAPAEGGGKTVPPAYRQQLWLAAVASRHTDIIDLELSSGAETIGRVRKACGAANVKLILSYHNFAITPSASVILSHLQNAQHWGADIAKAAVMPQAPEDVLTLLQATCQARRHALQIPLITMAMGDLGKITRLAGALFGSDVTFAAGSTASAPGQMSVRDVREVLGILGL